MYRLMLALYLIAAHMVGDFVLQTRWQAVGKFGPGLHARALRTRHCAMYSTAFVPVALFASSATTERVVLFLGALYLLHWLTDSRRFRSTLGDVVAWGWMTPSGTDPEIVDALALQPMAVYRTEVPSSPPPNPWTPAPILIDQALHIVQLALLGGLFLS